MSRQQDRAILRKLGEWAVKSVLHNQITRKDRRISGRIYANAAYREARGVLTYESKYLKYTPHPAILGWMAKEWDRYDQEIRKSSDAAREGCGDSRTRREDDRLEVQQD